jgi:hypothetical protein
MGIINIGRTTAAGQQGVENNKDNCSTDDAGNHDASDDATT